MTTPPTAVISDIGTTERLNTPAKFLVCVDRTEVSRVALRFACIKAKKRGGLVDVLHIIEPANSESFFSVADKMKEEMRQEAEELMQELCKEAYDISGIMPSILLKEGKIGEQILETAVEDYDANMLVLGVTPGGGKRGKLIAWLSTQMGEALLIPVMLVPGNLTDQQIEELS